MRDARLADWHATLTRAFVRLLRCHPIYWLLNFIDRPLTSGATRSVARAEVKAFIDLNDEWLTASLAEFPSVLGHVLTRLERDRGFQKSAQWPILRLQAIAKQVMDDLRVHRRFPVQRDVELLLLPDGGVFFMPPSGLFAHFRAAIATAVQRSAPRLKTCANDECGRWLIRIGRRGYCSSTCSQRLRTQKYRVEHRDRYLKARRERYAEQMRRTKAGGRRKIRIGARRPTST